MQINNNKTSKVIMNTISHRPSFLLAAHLLLGACQLHAADHSVSIVNRTGKTANDLHVTFGHKTGNPTCRPMTNTVASTDGGYNYTFDGGSVPPSGSATVNWSTKFSPDQIQEGYWTLNGTNIGNFGESTTAINYTNNPDGMAVVTFVNMDTKPVPFTNLMIFTGADQAFFSPATFVEQMTSGQFVETFVSPSGTFAPGTTLLAAF